MKIIPSETARRTEDVIAGFTEIGVTDAKI